MILFAATLKGSTLLFYPCDNGRVDYDLPEFKLGLLFLTVL